MTFDLFHDSQMKKQFESGQTDCRFKCSINISPCQCIIICIFVSLHETSEK